MQSIIGSNFPKIVKPYIEQAKNSIDIIVFDWRFYPQDPGAQAQLFNQSIINASKRGVKVRAIINNSQILTYLKSHGIQAKQLLSKKLVHCKLMIIDNKICVVGSHNYTQNAFQMNLELSISFEITDETQEIVTFFNNIFQSTN
jgi:phosphatidylserine/phosphatidylglycerophosphate/cardiolipin synthase-like enzyme